MARECAWGGFSKLNPYQECVFLVGVGFTPTRLSSEGGCCKGSCTSGERELARECAWGWIQQAEPLQECVFGRGRIHPDPDVPDLHPLFAIKFDEVV